MNSNMDDRRVRRTKKLLRQGLAEALKEKPLKAITVKEISDRIDINRGTFYLHYQDIYDMTEKIGEEMFGELNEIFSSAKPGKDNRLLIAEKLYTYMASNSAMCAALLGVNGDIAFMNRVQSLVKEKYLNEWITLYNVRESKNFEHFYSFVSFGCNGIILAWLENGMKETPAEMAVLTKNMISHCAKVL
jgi:AcrR family transcriptional regulator